MGADSALADGLSADDSAVRMLLKNSSTRPWCDPSQNTLPHSEQQKKAATIERVFSEMGLSCKFDNIKCNSLRVKLTERHYYYYSYHYYYCYYNYYYYYY